MAQAVAFALPHPTLGEDVAAAVVLKQENSTDPRAIREFLFERLTDFKIPAKSSSCLRFRKARPGNCNVSVSPTNWANFYSQRRLRREMK